AIMVGTGLGAGNGILIRNGAVLEKVQKINAIAFDKTGTITVGKPEIVDMKIIDETALEIAYSLEKVSEHPLADAFVKYAEKKVSVQKIGGFEAIPGKGIMGKIGKKECYLGNEKLMKENKIDISSNMISWKNENEEKGSTVVLLAVSGKIIGAFAIADKIREDSREAIIRLKNLGLKTYMITGDSKKVAAAVAGQAGIEEYFAEVLPADKAKIVEKIRADGQVVAMVGDGINDAPALAVSDLGIAMGSGTDVAIETGDIILMKNSLLDVDKAIKLSKATMNKIKQNLFWALVYNIIGIPIAAGVLWPFGILLSPMIAGGAMALSSISVVSNSVLLNRIKL
ncbi:MAG: heavy metal translocating P-type ATPase, partial [Candidatus Micrarchaeota archaeon]